MKETTLTIEIADDRSTATITFLPASGVTGSLQVAPDQLLKLITALGSAHAAMVAGKEMPDIVGQQVDSIVNTRWYVGTEMAGEASQMSFYHPSFGVVGFLVPIDQVEYMARLLNDHVEAARASRSGLRN